MPSTSIIGNGTTGQAIAAAFGRGGASVQTLGRDDAATPVTGDIVVLAVPHAAVETVVTARAGELAGKTVVAAALPDSHVLEAFNTNFAATVVSGVVGDVPTTVLIAGDDTDAKAALGAVLVAGGLRAIDAGSLRRARELEALGFLQISLAAGEELPWTAGFAVIS